MSMRLSTALVVLALATASAQQTIPGAPVPPGTPAPQPPGSPRMPPRAARPGEDPLKGTAMIRGYVTAADTGAPLRRALVRAQSQDGRNSGMALTDGQGRFEIKELLAGRYTVSVSKAGYVGMSYGQRRPEQQGTVLEILDGQLVDKMAFVLPRGGVITGTILDEFGEPIAGAQVQAMRYRYFNGARRLMSTGGGSTDDRGMFRLYGLNPGDYFISASVRAPQQMVGPTNVSSPPVEGYAATYFPGTPSPAEATRITVRAMQEASNINFALIATRLSRLSGRAITSSGAPLVQGMLMLTPADRATIGMLNFGNATTRADGTFQMAGVAAGTYELQVRPRGMPTADAEFATMRITVGQDDIDNITIVTSRGAVAYGVITTDENAPLPFRPEQVTIFARPVEPEAMIVNPGTPKINEDWTFELNGLSDQRLFTANIAENPDWALKAVLHNGVDITDTPIEFVPGRTVEGLQLVFSRKLTELTGRITAERNMPETDATVIVFSQDPARWGFATRYIRTARPNQDGRYTLRGLPPHDYLVVAVKDIEVGQWQDPEFLEAMRAHAARVSLEDGGKAAQDLKVIRP